MKKGTITNEKHESKKFVDEYYFLLIYCCMFLIGVHYITSAVANLSLPQVHDSPHMVLVYTAQNTKANF